jgi:hypothetical protein
MFCTPLQTWLLINTGSGQQPWSNKLLYIQRQQGLHYLSRFILSCSKKIKKKHSIAAGDLDWASTHPQPAVQAILDGSPSLACMIASWSAAIGAFSVAICFPMLVLLYEGGSQPPITN